MVAKDFRPIQNGFSWNGWIQPCHGFSKVCSPCGLTPSPILEIKLTGHLLQGPGVALQMGWGALCFFLPFPTSPQSVWRERQCLGNGQCGDCRIQWSILRAGENPYPSRRAVRQLAGSLEVHQRGRGWEVINHGCAIGSGVAVQLVCRRAH